MSDFIYPQCPSCGEKASSGEGTSLKDVSSGEFWWTCPSCKKRHRGLLGLASHSVDWKETKKPKLRHLIVQNIPKSES